MSKAISEFGKSQGKLKLKSDLKLWILPSSSFFFFFFGVGVGGGLNLAKIFTVSLEVCVYCGPRASEVDEQGLASVSHYIYVKKNNV